jgi:uncharacterized coiled-coil protein SlyX
MDLEHERRLTEVETRAKSNTKRIDKIEEQTEAINRLATSMAVMAEKQDETANIVTALDDKVTKLEEKPAKRWEKVIETLLVAIVSALAGFVAARLGLG